MPIAAKPIAGCSPIAAGMCNSAPAIWLVDFFGQTSVVFDPIMDDSSIGDCITAYGHHNSTTVCPYYDSSVVPEYNDETTAYPHHDDASAGSPQKCKEAA